MKKIEKIAQDSKDFEILFREGGGCSAYDYQLTDMMRGVVLKINEVIDTVNNNDSIDLEKINSDAQYDNESLVHFFFNRIVGDCQVDCSIFDEKSGSYRSVSLKETLREFAEIIQAKELVEDFNPITKEFVLIDKSKGHIISSSKNPFFAKKNE